MATETTVPTTHRRLLKWVDDAVSLCKPDDVHWCDGSAEEYDQLCRQLVEAGTFERLSDAKRPNSYLARSNPSDVSRVEGRTFICVRCHRTRSSARVMPRATRMPKTRASSAPTTMTTIRKVRVDV